ncbi:Rossmann-fold NAD(P)-binding domain-containing protein [Sphingomonas radiodurans]|uniref:NAD(P)-dependent oxidoreductase n=1 Tax=Sphingomonas radiodurans TaxID=2890321 RepID=UPI001E3A334E|nr:NAD(P)-dependent oxidoreductase [Sphingomonas radiodurans]WBH15382.1 NAD(P)-dependent oxidoreductase [Sphingomonas radiodurans]
MSRLFVFGLGYTARAIVRESGWPFLATTRDGRDGTIRFDDAEAVRAGLAISTHVLSSVPPDEGGDPVLDRYGDALGGRWLGYLSSTGVYGDAGGAWVDETTPIRGRRANRNAADAAWLSLEARVFRLPGIYGPGRSPLDRVAAGQAHRTGIAGQVFSRVHVDDIARGVVAGFDGPAGAYNLADDLPTSQDEVIEHAARLLGVAPPPLVALDTLSPMARAFYAENRRVANGKAKRVLGWRPLYADYRLGLRAVSATISPAPASSAPPAASGDQR